MDTEKHTAPLHSTPAKSGWKVMGYDATMAPDVLRRLSRKPLTADGKPTVETAGNVITVTMPNASQWRLTMVAKEIPATVTADDVKTWEYAAPPAVAK